MIDWNETADLLIAEIYASVNQFNQADAILERIALESSNHGVLHQAKQLQ